MTLMLKLSFQRVMMSSKGREQFLSATLKERLYGQSIKTFITYKCFLHGIIKHGGDYMKDKPAVETVISG